MLDIIEEADRQLLLGAKGTAGELAAYVLEFYMGFYKSVYGRSAAPCPRCVWRVAIAKGDMVPRLAPVVAVEVDTTDGPGRGQTICDLRGRFPRLSATAQCTQPGGCCKWQSPSLQARCQLDFLLPALHGEGSRLVFVNRGETSCQHDKLSAVSVKPGRERRPVVRQSALTREHSKRS